MKERVLRRPKIGEVYNMYFDGKGSVQTGLRPGVVFQNNVGNAHSPNTIALPLTTNLKRLDMPTHVFIKSSANGLRYDSMVICENPKCISMEAIGGYITTLSEETMKKIAVAYLLATSAISFIDLRTLVNTWESAIRLNTIA